MTSKKTIGAVVCAAALAVTAGAAVGQFKDLRFLVSAQTDVEGPMINTPEIPSEEATALMNVSVTTFGTSSDQGTATVKEASLSHALGLEAKRALTDTVVADEAPKVELVVEAPILVAEAQPVVTVPVAPIMRTETVQQPRFNTQRQRVKTNPWYVGVYR